MEKPKHKKVGKCMLCGRGGGGERSGEARGMTNGIVVIRGKIIQIQVIKKSKRFTGSQKGLDYPIPEPHYHPNDRTNIGIVF